MNELASIIIVTFNRLPFTKLVLQSILHNTTYPNYELIILDNKSTDGTIEYLKQLQSQHKEISQVIYHQTNIGKGKAANKGFALAKGQYIIGLDNDVLVPRNWLTELVKALNTVPNIGWLCINLSNLEKDKDYFKPDYERRYGDIVIQETPGVGGQCVAMKSSTYNKLGGYYDDIYYGLEDAEYNMRFRNQGLLTGYLMNVVGYHLGGTPEEKHLFPNYQQYKIDIINGINQGDFTLAYTDFYNLSDGQWIKPELTAEQIQSPEIIREGKLIKGIKPSVFFFYGGYKYEIPSIQVFETLNFHWEDVQIIDQQLIDILPAANPLFI